MNYVIYFNFFPSEDVFSNFRYEIQISFHKRESSAILIQYYTRQYLKFKQIFKTILLIDDSYNAINLNFFILRNYIMDNIPKMKKYHRTSGTFSKLIFLFICHYKNKYMVKDKFLYPQEIKMLKELDVCFHKWINYPTW